MNSSPKYWVIIPAAGYGARMATAVPKQYLSLAGKTVLEHTLERWVVMARIEAIVVVVAKNDPYWPTMSLKQHPKIHTVTGGLERMHSVLNGLHYLQDRAHPDDWVLVHDAARPCVRHSDVALLIDAVKIHPVGGLLACPVRDTMKRSRAGVASVMEVLETVKRDDLWHALTPQMFRLELLRSALVAANKQSWPVTDEAAAIEGLGLSPLLVEGARDNLKITYPDDLALAQFYLERQTEWSDIP